MLINILKCHGSGNDFILIDEWSNGYKFSEEQRVILSQTLCDRKSSLGADGILFFYKSDKADAGMRIFNSDGSEAEMCGNGLRCLARYALELLKKDEDIDEDENDDSSCARCRIYQRKKQTETKLFKKIKHIYQIHNEHNYSRNHLQYSTSGFYRFYILISLFYLFSFVKNLI